MGTSYFTAIRYPSPLMLTVLGVCHSAACLARETALPASYLPFVKHAFCSEDFAQDKSRPMWYAQHILQLKRMLYAENSEHGMQAMCALMDQKHLFHHPGQMTVLTKKLSLHLPSQCTAGTSRGGCSLVLGQSKFKGKQNPTFFPPLTSLITKVPS